MAADETVRFAITAFSRPGDPLVRLSGPLGRRVQVLATKAYLRALARFVDGTSVDGECRVIQPDGAAGTVGVHDLFGDRPLGMLR